MRLRELYPAEVDYKAMVEEARRLGVVDRESREPVVLAMLRLTDAVESLLAIEQRLTDHIVQLAAERDALQAENAQLQVYLSENRRALDDAINVANGNKTARDALQAENEKHRADLHEWETVGAPAWVAAKDAQIAEVWAGRDALQARLDAMTVEWGVALPDEDGFETPDRATAESFVRDYPEEEYSLVQRLVGPWTAVPEGDANA